MHARINTGVSGMTLASTAYQNALAYTRERIQGSSLTGEKSGYVPIIEHPDVRRMLLWMKAIGGRHALHDLHRSLLVGPCLRACPKASEKERYQNLVDFMTPIIKAYCSDMGFRVCETAIQCLGGYGFCKDYPLEQYLRDAKIMSLYEGTNGIQSMDLMGRKMSTKGGALFNEFKSEIEHFCSQHREHPELGDRVRALAGVAGRLWEVCRGNEEENEQLTHRSGHLTRIRPSWRSAK